MAIYIIILFHLRKNLPFLRHQKVLFINGTCLNKCFPLQIATNLGEGLIQAYMVGSYAHIYMK